MGFECVVREDGVLFAMLRTSSGHGAVKAGPGELIGVFQMTPRSSIDYEYE